ncbi:Maf family protein [Riemerella columbina]|uniref:Maf family protein n=1 Tax=Riemerella columbina TaxID=103810 RepID=UPI00266F7F2A|nr:Maf family protein [Riemerella columbina]WKS95205.1 Maf family protein [Riemerella columbina]
MRKQLYLASQSPRRKELLEQLGYPFQVVSINCEEIYPKEMPVSEVAGYLSQLKAEAFRALEPHEVLLTADTIIAVENEVLGKPKDEAHAKTMLRQLSGRTHQVYTGISLRTAERIITKTDVAKVTFFPMTEAEMDFYIQKFKPWDKAGAYGIQEWLGMAKIQKIEGSFYTIMGLPTHLVYEILSTISDEK